MPGRHGISDPGEIIVKKAIKENVEVTPVPGACAFVNALVVSGLDSKNFQFIGFLPVNIREKEEILEDIKYNKNTLIFYEAPHKLLKTLESMLKIFGDRQIILAKEITKIHETFLRDSIANLIKKLEKEEKIKGEFVVLVEGSKISKKEVEKDELINSSLNEHYEYYEKQGFERKDIIKKIAKDRNVSKNEIYQQFLD